MDISYLILPATTLALGWLSGFFPTWIYGKSMEDLTNSQVRNPLQPPGYVFGIVWTTLYILMGLALALIWNANQNPWRTILLIMFGVQFTLNIAWTWIYYGLLLSQSVAATISLAVLVGTMLLSILLAAWFVLSASDTFSALNYIAAAMCIVPYLAWTVFASALHLNAMFLNPGK